MSTIRYAEEAYNICDPMVGLCVEKDVQLASRDALGNEPSFFRTHEGF